MQSDSLVDVVGRERELAAIGEFLDGPALIPALVLSGAAGIGKTILWETATALARRRGWNVLVSRASEAELSLSFAGLADLLDGVADEVLAELVAPQRRALAVALVRTEPAGAPPEPLAIASGLLSLLRLSQMGGHVLIAIDDAQWLDQPSAAALAFAARRALGERVRLLLTVRSGHTSRLEREIASRRLDIGEMTVLDARRLVSERLGLSLPRGLIGRVVEAAHGNPLVVLELGRRLAERGTLELEGEIPASELASDLFGDRVATLAPEVGHALLATALSASLTRAELAALAAPTVLVEAVAHGVLTVERERVRATHPLLAAAARDNATPERREAIHLELSQVLTDGPRAARHLALATTEPNEQPAASVARAADTALRRGATHDAVDLGYHAFRLTPTDGPNHIERLLTLGGYLLRTGELLQLRELLATHMDTIPHGAQAARAQLLIADASDRTGHEAHLELAIAESEGHPALRAAALAAKVMLFAVVRVERLADALKWAEEGVRAARSAGPSDVRRAMSSLAWARVLRGLPIDDLEQFSTGQDDGASLYEVSIERVAAVRHGFRGEIEQARSGFERLLEEADERGETISGETIHLHLCELALRVGDCEHARAALSAWEEWSVVEDLIPPRARCHALLAYAAGDAQPALERAEAAREITHAGWDRIETTRALGLASLLAGSPADAVEHLAVVWEHTERQGIEELGTFPVVPELVQALLELGRSEEARVVATHVRELATAQQHPWGLATAARCDATIALAAGWDEEAQRGLAAAAAAYGSTGLQGDRARTLLALGRSQRRYRKWGAARATLELAAAGFDQLGASGWAALARSELERVGARRPAGEGELTSAETRVVALAVDGCSNKEIASALVVSVHTVEVHLSHAYAKLGIRSRSQLAAALQEKPYVKE